MSVFRMLSPTRGSSFSSTRSSNTIQINIRVPSYGSVFMPFPDPLGNAETPRTDKELFGDLEIYVPHGLGRQKCKAIRIGVRTFCRLDMGRGKPEEDTIYEGKVEVRGGTSEGVILDEGMQRFAFNIIIPGNLAPHDYHSGHRVDNILYAEVEGAEDNSALGWLRRGSSPSSSRTNSRATSPASPRSGTSSGYGSPNPALTIMRQEAFLPQPPRYDLSESEEFVPWLSGVHRAERTLILIYNPDPAGGVSSLDTRMDVAAPGVGPLTVTYTSDEWSVAAVLKAKYNLPAPSPFATIFYIRASLVQNTEITSPRDGKKVKVTKEFPVFSGGSGMPKALRPGPDSDALWRGVQAGGVDVDELALKGHGRLPNDYEGRPTTLEGVETPIKVSHVLRTEVFFSVHGEDVKGDPLPDGGPGELRVMYVNKSVVLPACFLIPEVLNLPIYEADDDCPWMSTADGKTCPLCKTDSANQFCRECPPTAVPHPRHDHPAKLVGNPSGICYMCSQRVIPTGSGEWRDCACKLGREMIIDRMKRICLKQREEHEEEEERRGRRGREEKEEAERGVWAR